MRWLTDAVWNERRRKNPEQFQLGAKVNLSDEDLTSETNRVMGWAVKDCCDQIADPKSSDRLLLEQMICLEKDVSEDYMRERYDLLTLCRNVRAKGGLSLVTDAFFDWEKRQC